MWTTILDLGARIGDKLGSTGSAVGAMACAMCFPATASIGAFLGLGFLSQWEGLFLNTLLPLFAGIALVANLLTIRLHRQPVRAVVSIAGPLMVLGTLYPFWNYGWSTWMFYAGLVVMLLSSAWDIAAPPRAACRPDNSSTGRNIRNHEGLGRS